MPSVAMPLWLLFLDLHAGRQYGGMGSPQGLSYAELDAFARVRRRPWQRYELDAVRAVDRAFLASAAEQWEEARAASARASDIDALREPPRGLVGTQPRG